MASSDTLGLKAAEWTENTAGPFVGLMAYRKLLDLGADPGFRASAVLGMFRCATRLGDTHKEIAAAAAVWSTLSGGGEHLAAIIEICKRLVAAGRRWDAVKVAGGEVERTGKARATYLFARCLELAGDGDGAFDAFGLAIKRAEEEGGAADVAVAARARRVERTRSSPDVEPLTVKDAERAASAPPLTRLWIARGCLRSPKQFVRAAGLAILEELSRDPTTSLGRLALRLAAEHADALGDLLTPVEADRVATALGHIPDEKARASALARLATVRKIMAARGAARDEAIMAAAEIAPEIFPAVCRARAVIAGGGQGPYAPHPSMSVDGEPPALRIASLGLDVVVALARGRGGEAGAALEEASRLLPASPAIPPPAWSAAFAAINSREPAVRDAGIRLVEALLDRAATPPPQGFFAFAIAIKRAGRGDLAVRMARAAAVAREPGAREELGALLRDEGWRLAALGNKEAAIRMLSEAKELFVMRGLADKKG